MSDYASLDLEYASKVLTDAQLEVIVRHANGLGYGKIADELEISTSAVRQRLAAARVKVGLPRLVQRKPDPEVVAGARKARGVPILKA